MPLVVIESEIETFLRQNNFITEHQWVKGIQVCSDKVRHSIPGGEITRTAQIQVAVIRKANVDK